MLVVMLPTYNEAAAIVQLLGRIAEAFERIPGAARVLVVDDGSTDGSGAAAKAAALDLGLALEVATHDVNRGLGEALRTGLGAANALLRGEGALVVMDADNTHDPAVIGAMLRKLDEGDDVVIASRYAPGGREVGLSLRRRTMSRGAGVLLGLFLPVAGARDYTCGYRAYRGSILARALREYGDSLITEPGFTASAEILIKMSRLPARVGEVPLVLRYDLKRGKSKMRIGRTVAGYLRLVSAGRRAPAPRARSRAAGAPSSRPAVGKEGP